jgi:outer membrane protein assembly factor BamB
MSSPILHDGLVYGFSHFKTGQFFCLNPESGEVIWKGAPRTGENAQFLSLPGNVLALTDDGLCRILRGKGGSYDVARTYRVAEDQTWTAPAVVDDMLLIKDLAHLTLWRLPKSAD